MLSNIPMLQLISLTVASLVVGGGIHAEIPTLWLIGDSTVRNGSGTGEGQQWGWGDCLSKFFDTTKIRVVNRAIGGRSSRTFLTDGRWGTILSEMKAGDFVIMQFGHNDGGKVNDDSRARGTIRGIGDEIEEIENMLTKKHETVHTYGWYMAKYIKDAKEHAATPIVCSLIPRCPQPGTKLESNPEPATYRLWAQQVAAREKAAYIDLNLLIWREFVKMEPEQIKAKYYCATDFTHTNLAGAEFNAGQVVSGIKALPDCPLAKFLVGK
jgi:rhamnogalacturonan acetylesterase